MQDHWHTWRLVHATLGLEVYYCTIRGHCRSIMNILTSVHANSCQIQCFSPPGWCNGEKVTSMQRVSLWHRIDAILAYLGAVMINDENTLILGLFLVMLVGSAMCAFIAFSRIIPLWMGLTGGGNQSSTLTHAWMDMTPFPSLSRWPQKKRS